MAVSGRSWQKRVAAIIPHSSGVLLEAASGLEPLNGGFADLSLSHLGTPPLAYQPLKPASVEQLARRSGPINSGSRRRAPQPRDLFDRDRVGR